MIVRPLTGRTYRRYLDQPYLEGAYPLFLGRGIRDLDGNALDQDRDGIAGERADDIFSALYPVQASNTVSGLKFHDLDGDGIQDANEPGVEGVRIYVDQNQSGTWDTGEPITVTDANGYYTFHGTSPGQEYTVRELVDPGWLPTRVGPLDSFQYQHLIDIVPGSAGSTPHDFVALDGVIYFSAENPGTGDRRLWSFDGETAAMVTDAHYPTGISEPQELTVGDGRLFFSAFHGDVGRELGATIPPAVR